MPAKRYVVRIYSGKDTAMLNQAQTMRALFVELISDFAAYRATFNAQFAQDWQQAIDDAFEHPRTPTSVELTAIKIRKLNKVWGFASQVSAASKQMYIHSPARMGMFVLQPKRKAA